MMPGLCRGSVSYVSADAFLKALVFQVAGRDRLSVYKGWPEMVSRIT